MNGGRGSTVLGRASRALVIAALCVGAERASASFTPFESGPVRPLALSADGKRLFAANTPDGTLEIFRVDGNAPERVGSVPVGLEPVAVAVRDAGEVWVVNHLSDSVNIVDVASNPPRVVRTLLVGDEPRDIVFAGPSRGRAFITTAHRGQNSPVDPELTTPGVGRADVWVFDAANLGTSLGGTPLAIVTLFGDTPRALATNADASVVYAAVFHSGNQTTIVNDHLVCDGAVDAQCYVDGLPMPGGLPEPRANVEGIPGPEVGLIVKLDPPTGAWRDELGRDWREAIRFDLPDYDVFAIDALADPPREIDRFASVGTILYNMAVNPVSGRVYVSNTEARNETRFSGPGVLAGHTVRGHLHEARITVVDPASGSVEPRHLDKHIDYSVVPSPPETKERSLATPVDLAVTADGATLYVAAFGSSKVGVFQTAALEDDTFVPEATDHIAVSGGGPGGLALDEARGRLYVLTRFDDSVSAIDTAERRETAHVPMHNPEPAEIVNGRRFLYDATLTSSNGEASCSACHVFGDVDDLGWDLGDPDDVVQTFGNHFHPMKGPMTVQTLRGISTHGPMHWRGDRTGEAVGGDPKDERLAFFQFNEAFEGLLGRDAPLTEAEMEAYTDFVLSIVPPPNPIRSLDNQLTVRQAAGKQVFESFSFVGCGCHVLAPEQGFFGTAGDITIALETQLFKVPQLRNMYARVGMFGMAGGGMFGVGSTSHMGPQIRGFGYLHDGSVDTLFRFLSASIFGLQEEDRRLAEAFLLVFPSDLAPVVGQQVTFSGGAAAEARVELLEERAAQAECDLTVKGVVGGEARGWVLGVDGNFRSDRAADSALTPSAVEALASAATPLTYTCVPPGSGQRMGVDRDDDGFLDGDELDLCGDPADAASGPRLASPCVGDCDRNCEVGIDELVRGVGLALGNGAGGCPRFDQDGDGTIAVSELILGVNNSLGGCSAD